MWALLSEVLQRPIDEVASSTVPGSVRAVLPTALSEPDRWQLLLWAAIQCALHWYDATHRGGLEAATRLSTTLHQVRRLVPFLETVADAGGARWAYLGERELASAPAPPPVPPPPPPPQASEEAPSLLLLTLFGQPLWGNLTGLELRGRPPAFTAAIPMRLLSASHQSGLPPVHAAVAQLECAVFPEHLGRRSLALVWEWFLLEVAGALPPTVLWATVNEPILRSSRPHIRAAIALLASQGRRAADDGGGGAGNISDDDVEDHVPLAESMRTGGRDARGGGGSSSQDGGGSSSRDRGGGRSSHDAAGLYSSSLSLEAALLESVLQHTQVRQLLDEMDASDEMRRLAAEEEARRPRLWDLSLGPSPSHPLPRALTVQSSPSPSPRRARSVSPPSSADSTSPRRASGGGASTSASSESASSESASSESASSERQRRGGCRAGCSRTSARTTTSSVGSIVLPPPIMPPTTIPPRSARQARAPPRREASVSHTPRRHHIGRRRGSRHRRHRRHRSDVMSRYRRERCSRRPSGRYVRASPSRSS